MTFRQVGTMPVFGRGIYVGGSLEAGRTNSTNNNIAPERAVYAASLFVGLDTAIGPFYLGYGHATGSRRSAYLFLGRP